MPTCLPLVLRRCHACAAGRLRTSGKFRVNAHHKLIDVWLLALCTACGQTAKLTVMERVNVRSVPRALLDRLHDNDPGLAAELLQDPVVQRRGRMALDWTGAWRLDTGRPARPDQPDRSDHSGRPDHPDHPAREDGREADCEVLDVSVRFAARIPVRPVRLIAEGCGLSRAEVERLLAEGRLVSAVRLSGRTADDFTFTLKR